MERETFVFYKKWAEAISGLPSEIKLEIYESIIAYATTGKVPDLKMTAQIGFNFVKTDIDRDLEKYQKTIEKNRENGKKGGRPKNPKNPLGFHKTQPNPKNLDNDNEYDNDNDVLLKKEPKERENLGEVKNFSESNPQTANSQTLNTEKSQKEKSCGKKEKGFTKPTLKEIENYCQERQNGISAETFWNFYEAKGWMIGKNKMKDWKAAIRTWEQKRKEDGITNKNRANSAGSNTGYTTGSTNGKVTARQLLARELERATTNHNNGENFTATTEIR